MNPTHYEGTGCAAPTAILASLLLFLLLSGCCRSRLVTIEREAPPASVVTRTDTVRLASPPDTLFVERVRREVVEREGRIDTVIRTVTRTVPQRVVEYVERRDSTDGFELHAVTVDSATVRVDGSRRDHTFRRPEAGETLVIEAVGRDSLRSVVVGVPSRPPPLTVECPACPRYLIGAGLFGWLKLLALLSLAFCAGFVSRVFLRPL